MGFNKKNLAKNTLFMYSRMFLSMLISLYTSRVILATLGVSDYGIYNVIGGVLVMFSFVHGSLSNSTQRYLNIAKGTNDEVEIKRIFQVCLTNHVLISLVFLVLCEIVGYPAIYYFLNIPPDRIQIAYLVYHISIITTCLSIIQIPFETAIIAYEKHSVYAYMGIFYAIAKLLIVYLLVISSIDKLLSLSILSLFVSIITIFIYIVYVINQITPCIPRFRKERNLMKEMFIFSGWTLFGSVSELFSLTGVNLLFNWFHGVIVNAAYGVSNQVNSAVKEFVQGFKMSYTPQIIQTYSQSQIDSLFTMISFTSRVGFVLFYIPSFFIFINANEIFSWWLVDVPPFAVSFCRIILLCTLVDSISSPYYDVINATGIIKKYQICISISFFSDFILTLFFLYIRVDLNYILLSRLLTRGVANMLIGWYFLKKLIAFPLKKYLKDAIMPILIVIMSSSFVLCFASFVQLHFIVVNMCWLLLSLIAFYLVFSSCERNEVCVFFKNKLGI